MRTNIVLDDELVNEAFNYTHLKTKRELIYVALKEFVDNHKKMDVRQLRGKVKICEKYDHKLAREGKE